MTYAGDYVQPTDDGIQPEEILYDFYFADADEDKGEEAVYLFKYNESATGIYLVYTPHLQSLSMELSPWASEADVLLYGTFLNAVLAKHKRARLYEKYAPLKGLTDDNVQRMIKERKAHLKLSRQQLMDRIWEGVIVTERTVNVNITRLRKKLGSYASNIVSRQGFGYVFEVEP